MWTKFKVFKNGIKVISRQTQVHLEGHHHLMGILLRGKLEDGRALIKRQLPLRFPKYTLGTAVNRLISVEVHSNKDKAVKFVDYLMDDMISIGK